MTPPYPEAAVLAALQHIRTERQEHFLCVCLGSNRQIVACHTVFIGTVNSVVVHPRGIFAFALADRAVGIVVAHNHPSGEASPSGEDRGMTRQLTAAGQVLGIPVLDHIIVAAGEHYSFRGGGLIP